MTELKKQIFCCIFFKPNGTVLVVKVFRELKGSFTLFGVLLKLFLGGLPLPFGVALFVGPGLGSTSPQHSNRAELRKDVLRTTKHNPSIKSFWTSNDVT